MPLAAVGGGTAGMAVSFCGQRAAEVGGDVQVVELYTESLGEPGSDGETYIAMVVTNAERISGALA